MQLTDMFYGPITLIPSKSQDNPSSCKADGVPNINYSKQTEVDFLEVSFQGDLKTPASTRNNKEGLFWG